MSDHDDQKSAPEIRFPAEWNDRFRAVRAENRPTGESGTAERCRSQAAQDRALAALYGEMFEAATDPAAIYVLVDAIEARKESANAYDRMAEKAEERKS